MTPKRKTLKVSELNPAEYNPRVISKKAKEGLKTSLEKFGYIQDIVVNIRDGKNTIVGGHQRLDALGLSPDDKIQVTTVDLNDDDEKALEMLEYALDNGLYYWDTAASYGNRKISSEERIGKLLPGRRKEVFMVTKLGDRDGEGAKKSIERSLDRLQTDHIDLLHCHNLLSVEEAELLGKKGNVLDVLHDYRDQGIVKHIGFTGHASAAGMKRAAELYDFEVMMIALNHYVETTAQSFEDHAVPFAANKGMGVVAMKVIRPRETMEGLSAEMLIRYALSAEHFSLANIGTDSMEVLQSNLALIKDFKSLNPQEIEDLKTALIPFFQHKNLPWMHPDYVDGNLT